MRSFHYLAFAAGIALATACGGDGGNGPANTAPTANFTAACTDLDCTFTDLSDDSDGTVDRYAWTFDDGGTAGVKNPDHSYAATGSYDVTLTVTDNDGDTDSFTETVDVVAPPPGNNPPRADFDISCASLTCTFTDQSTDPDGDNTIVAWDWEFGDGGTSTLPNPAPHAFAATALTVYTIKLTVTDDQALTSTKTQQITISPPATFTCGTTTDCGLTLTEDAVVTVTLTSSSCTANGNTFRITQPVVETLFTDGCHSPTPGTPGATFPLNNNAPFSAGTEVHAEVISGSIKQVFLPALQVTGSYPTWTVKFDDGEGGDGEPDFNDLEFTVHAEP